MRRQVKTLELQLQAARETEESAERDQKQSQEALRQAEARIQELEHAWQVLAAKVVSLADRNADLEWVSIDAKDKVAISMVSSKGEQTSQLYVCIFIYIYMYV